MSTALQALSGETASDPTVIEQPEPGTSGGTLEASGDVEDAPPPLPEQYRPETLEELAGLPDIKKRLRAILKRRGTLMGLNFWIDGMSGTGKTTLAWIIARSMADEHNIRQLSAPQLTPAKLDDLMQEASMTGLGKKHGRVFIVNEVHGLRQDTRKQLLDTLEVNWSHVTWIFTTTRETTTQEKLFDSGTTTVEQTKAIVERCKHFSFPRDTEQLAEPMAKRAKRVAQQEGLDGKPLEDYIELCKEKDCSLRGVLQEIGSGVML